MLRKMENQTKLSNEKLNNPKRKKARKKAIIRSVILLLFLLGINTFAWFIIMITTIGINHRQTSDRIYF